MGLRELCFKYQLPYQSSNICFVKPPPGMDIFFSSSLIPGYKEMFSISFHSSSFITSVTDDFKAGVTKYRYGVLEIRDFLRLKRTSYFKETKMGLQGEKLKYVDNISQNIVKTYIILLQEYHPSIYGPQRKPNITDPNMYFNLA